MIDLQDISGPGLQRCSIHFEGLAVPGGLA